jgi:hypothetical protein
MKKVFSILTLVLISLAMNAPVALAAAPDGAGPWADSVSSYSPATRKNGSPIPPPRDNPSNAVGVAENTNANGTFVSLGFGGSIVLGFDTPISNGVVVVETTTLPYPTETAFVELSPDGSTWYPAGVVNQTGEVNMPPQLSCARYVRVTDTSNPEAFQEGSADGYDVDGVSAQEGVPCDTPAVPELGTVSAVMASLASIGGFVAMKKRQLIG